MLFRSAFGPYTTGELNTEFEILGAASNYITIDTGVQSTSATAGGGNTPAHAFFQLTVGGDINIFGNGWGVGAWVSQAPGAGSTTTTADITDTDTTIPVDDASAFAASGYVYIEAEWIQYAGKTGSSLTGCTRGIGDTMPTYHMSGRTVTGLQYSTALERGWNTGITLSDTVQGFREYLRLWSSDNYGQILVFNPDGGGIYYWDPTTGLSAGGAVMERGKNILDFPGADGYAPSIAGNVLVTEERHIVAFSVNDTSAVPPLNATQDPMLVAWCSQEDPATWQPSSTNTAGSQRLSSGSAIITVQSTRQEYLIWTDSSLYSMRYLGPPYVFGFNTLATDITIASANAVVTANNITYWMGQDKFYAYSGRVDTLPCSLRQYIFDDINTGQLQQIYSGQNEKYNEVWWFYPSAGSTYNNRYVIYNYLEKIWYYGQLLRSAWMGSHIQAIPIASYNRAAVLEVTGVNANGAVTSVDVIDGGQYSLLPPAATTAVGGTGANVSFVLTFDTTEVTGVTISQPGADYTVGDILTILGGQGVGNIIYHETGLNDDAVNPPIPLNAYIQSADFDLGDGNSFAFVSRLIPDIDFIGSTSASPSVNIILEGRDYPGQGRFEAGRQDTSVVSSSRVTTQVYNYTQQSWIRLRARQIAVRVGSNDKDVKWQLGVPRIRIQQDGLR